MTSLQQYKSLHIIAALASGLALSFLGLFSWLQLQTAQNFRGQVLAGDPTLNSGYPTTLNMFRATVGTGDAASPSMNPYVFWPMVVVCGIILGFFILKIIARTFEA